MTALVTLALIFGLALPVWATGATVAAVDQRQAVTTCQQQLADMEGFLDEAATRAEAMAAELDTAIATRDAAIAERDAAIAERDAAIAERDAAIAERKKAEAAVEDAQETIGRLIAARNSALGRIAELEKSTAELNEALEEERARLREIRALTFLEGWTIGLGALLLGIGVGRFWPVYWRWLETLPPLQRPKKRQSGWLTRFLDFLGSGGF